MECRMGVLVFYFFVTNHQTHVLKQPTFIISGAMDETSGSAEALSSSEPWASSKCTGVRQSRAWA